MKQLLQNLRSGSTTIEDVPAPGVGANGLLIQSRCSLISAGTEKMLVEFGQASLIGKARAQPDKVKQVLDKIKTDGLAPTLEAVFNRLDEPLPLGYCNAGVVLESGVRATEFQPGDRVVSNGSHAEIVSVPQMLCAKIPDSVSDEQAAFTVLASIGLQGVRLAQPTLGETVVVYGLGLVGLITVQLLVANGCQVIGIDINPMRLKLAEQFGAMPIDASADVDVVAVVQSMTEARGADAILITASAKTDEIVHSAAQMCRVRGRIVLVGVVGLNLRRSDFYEKEITFQVSCSYGPGRYDDAYESQGHDYPVGYVRWTEQRNFCAVLNLMASGRLAVEELITHRYQIEEAPSAYGLIQNDPSALGVVLGYGEICDRAATLAISPSPAKAVGDIVLGVIGVGNFSKMTLMPALSKTSARVKYLVGRSSPVAISHLAKKFNVEVATTDQQVVLDDPEVNAVMISTRHDSHAALVCDALNAGKHVFVEKPLALNPEQLDRVASLAASVPEQHVMVGFNRRFSPHIVKMKELLQGRGEPLAMTFTANAGIIPPDVWVHSPESGGGRIIGEACHFLDLMVFLTDSSIESVAAHHMGKGVAIRDDKMSISLGFADGSIGTVNYFANGSKKYPKESLEVFSDGRILKMDNFRKTTGYGFQGFKSLKTSRQDKGHNAQFAAFAQRLSDGGNALISMNQHINVTLASFAAVTAAHERRTVILEAGYRHLLSEIPV